MRLVFTTLFSLMITSLVMAQINSESDFPADFVINSPLSIAGTYPYGTQTFNDENPEIWGPELSSSLSGELVWAFSADDSLVCSAVVNDVAGKFALIRRGECDFSEKVLFAQNAGAIAAVIVNHYTGLDANGNPEIGTSLVGMLGGDSTGSEVTIPAVFISRNTGELITDILDNGGTIDVSFRVNSFFDPISSFSYQTPLEEAQEINIFSIKYLNPNPTDFVSVAVSAEITAPSGTTTTLSGTSDIGPLGLDTIELDGSFLPTELGEHTVVWTHDQSDETNESSFTMTEQTFAVNRDELGISVGPSDADFSSTFGFVYQVGGLVLPDADGAVASYASFGITNASDLFTGDIESDAITIILYDADFNDDNTLDFTPGGGSFNDLVPVALAEYIIKGTEGEEELIYVELEDLDDGDNLVSLKPDGAYYIVIAYDGVNAGTGVAPRFLGSTNTEYINFPTTPLFLDVLYSGWDNATVAVQLHLAGFVVGTDDLVSLDVAKVNVVPNPVETELNLEFALEEVADKVNIGIVDVSGKTLGTYVFDQVYQNNVQIDVHDLAAGVYFVNIMTPEGYRSVKIVKM